MCKPKMTKLNGLSLFSSVGLAETYFKDYDIDMKIANELTDVRAKFHKHLYPDCKMIVGDITQTEIKQEIIDEAIHEKVDFVIATPPCQGMSLAGLRRKDDVRNRLILDAVEIIQKIKPKFIIFENVPIQLKTSILIDDEWVMIPDYLKRTLGDMYSFNKKNILNAMDYGVPQSRERCVMLLVRKDMGFEWEFPKEKKIVTLEEAIGNLPSLDPNVTDISEHTRNLLFPEYERKKEEGLKVSKWHHPPKHVLRHVVAMQHTPSGCSAWHNHIYYPKLKDGSRSKGFKTTYKRQSWDKPAATVLQNNGSITGSLTVHPGRMVHGGSEEDRCYSDARVFSIYELIIVSSLPTDWDIPEWANDTLIRNVIGEGVPPRLIAAALESLREHYK